MLKLTQDLQNNQKYKENMILNKEFYEWLDKILTEFYFNN